MTSAKCLTCIYRDGCYDADTGDAQRCEHYRNKQPKPFDFDWNCINKAREAKHGKNEQ